MMSLKTIFPVAATVLSFSMQGCSYLEPAKKDLEEASDSIQLQAYEVLLEQCEKDDNGTCLFEIPSKFIAPANSFTG